MLSLIENKEFKTILDTGFGKGAFLNELVNHPFKKISGIEINTPFFNKILKTIDNTNSTLKLLNDDYLNYKFIEKFDTIIGNPPYLKSDLLTPLMKENVRKITQSGEGNIYYAFILKSIELLKEEGELVYIVPYDFFFNTYGECVRKCMVENGYLDTLIYLGDYPLFFKSSTRHTYF